jgi:hypothetical protein
MPNDIDTAADTTMAIFDAYHTLTITTPTEEVINRYNEEWPLIYPSMEHLQHKMQQQNLGLDPEQVWDMFRSFLT